MVAYSFAPAFAPQVSLLDKLQTVRRQRARHARPGEPIQLYCGMRTASCRKLLTVDPVCVRVDDIVIAVTDLIEPKIASIEINGISLHRDEIEEFARADGFAPERINGLAIDLVGKTARENMGLFWRARHGLGFFSGNVIHWKPER